MLRIATLVAVTLCSVRAAHADDASACKAGDTQACARIGRLKSAGALGADGKADVPKLLEACGKQVDATTSSSGFSLLANRCSQLFNPSLRKSYDAIGGTSGDMLGMLLANAYGEAYCPLFDAKKIKAAGCNGKRFVDPPKDKLVPTLSSLNAAALRLEHGDAAAALIAKFDARWAALLK
jgi:hypothetical protein